MKVRISNKRGLTILVRGRPTLLLVTNSPEHSHVGGDFHLLGLFTFAGIFLAAKFSQV